MGKDSKGSMSLYKLYSYITDRIFDFLEIGKIVLGIYARSPCMVATEIIVGISESRIVYMSQGLDLRIGVLKKSPVVVASFIFIFPIKMVFLPYDITPCNKLQVVFIPLFSMIFSTNSMIYSIDTNIILRRKS